MKIYQLLVTGSSATFSSQFKMHSKRVYKELPSEEEKEKFVQACADEKYIDYLDITADYEVKVLELELVE